MTADRRPRSARPRADGAGPAHREGRDSAASAAAAIDVDTGAVPATDPRAAHESMRAGERVTLLDVRGADEVAAWRIEGPNLEYLNVPAAEFVDAHPHPQSVRDLVSDLDGRPVAVVCPRGRASRRVAAVLRAADVEATTLDGGMRGWARVHVAEDVDRDGDLRVRQYDRPASGCLSCLLTDGERAVVVDPLRAFVDRYLADADDLGVEIAAVVDTHVHADHVSGLRQLAGAADASAVVPAGALDRGLADPDSVRTVGDGDRIAVGEGTLTVVALPGHTSETVGLRAGGVLLSGDSLFLESVARPDLEAGDESAPDLARRLYRTLHETVLAMPDETLLAPGHHGSGVEPAADGTYTAPLAEVRERLPVLDLDEAAFVDRLVGDLGARPPNYRTIVEVNLGRTDVSAGRAATLELGPNNCAVDAGD
jgi:glyoxylase-like metal-dependent hydrolase (beta-lactamase superfamily II)